MKPPLGVWQKQYRQQVILPKTKQKHQEQQTALIVRYNISSVFLFLFFVFSITGQTPKLIEKHTQQQQQQHTQKQQQKNE